MLLGGMAWVVGSMARAMTLVSVAIGRLACVACRVSWMRLPSGGLALVLGVL